MKKLIAIFALASSMGAAYADQPVALNDAQMDNVTAGLEASGAQATGIATALVGATQVTASARTTATWFGTSARATSISTAVGLLPASASRAEAASIKF